MWKGGGGVEDRYSVIEDVYVRKLDGSNVNAYRCEYGGRGVKE